MFNKEYPISNISEDLLSRDIFVDSLVSSIKNYVDKESLTIGLYGKWGEGKTSVINLLKEKLENKQILFILSLSLGFIQIQNS